MSSGPATGSLKFQVVTVAACMVAITALGYILWENNDYTNVEADLGVSYCEVYDVGEPTQHYSAMVYRNSALIVHPKTTVADDGMGNGKATAHIIFRINDNNDSALGLCISLNDDRTVLDDFLISTDNHATFRGYHDIKSDDLEGVLPIGNRVGEYHITINLSFVSGTDPGFSITVVNRG